MFISTTNTPKKIYRKNYTVPTYILDTIEITIYLNQELTRIITRIVMHHNPITIKNTILLYGENIELLNLSLNGKTLTKNNYLLKNNILSILDAPLTAILNIETAIQPKNNTSLMGLYISHGNFFTQCEPEGFRKITYFPDRPDVMGIYTVILHADKQQYPVLLSNGNLIAKGNLNNNQHYTKWKDPFKKPSYLFALVAGKLVCHEEKYKLKSGRIVLLQIWVEKNDLNKTDYAMNALKNSISWDEENFGLELDLDRFMIVAVNDFNMGAMENKGLNIFNTKFVLANMDIATDADFFNIESVVAHEYFHNWTGNRVTCRDWFQLSLKEGLTVFREQEFSSDMFQNVAGRAVNRINNVRLLREIQFLEDSGPMTHPIRPNSFIEINNFYTVTVYEKGAEVVRMYQTLLGNNGFRKGMDLYFKRHDGQAVTCDDFLQAMSDANTYNFKQFKRWYSQSGTPIVEVIIQYNIKRKTLKLILKQSCLSRLNEKKKFPFYIPIAVGLLDSNGKDMPLTMKNESQCLSKTRILKLKKTQQTFTFININEKPLLSILRNFSAPIILKCNYTNDDLAFLMIHDSDLFNRWEAGQRYMTRYLLDLITVIQILDKSQSQQFILNVLQCDNTLSATLYNIINDDTLHPAFRELFLILPSEKMISNLVKIIDPQIIHTAYCLLRRMLAKTLCFDLLNIYKLNQTKECYRPDSLSAGKRALKNIALSYLIELNEIQWHMLAEKQYNNANNMTDKFAALTALINSHAINRESILKNFYQKFQHEQLLINKWFTLQATTYNVNISNIRNLIQHPAFKINNPNCVYSLIFSFCNDNPSSFHAIDGSGYEFWVEQVITINNYNPQLAAHLAHSLDHWQKYTPILQKKMYDALYQVVNTINLSRDVFEVVTKALDN